MSGSGPDSQLIPAGDPLALVWQLDAFSRPPRHPLLALEPPGQGSAAAARIWRSRLNRWRRWQAERGQYWFDPDLAAWRDHLLQVEGRQASTVGAYLNTVRTAYRRLLNLNVVRDALYAALPHTPLAVRQACAYEVEERLRRAIDPLRAPLDLTRRQDVDARVIPRLEHAQIRELLLKPGVGTLRGLRDTALIALLLCTGLRVGEVVQLDVPDLRGDLDGELAVVVREGKGRKLRLVPYGALAWGLALAEAWLEAAGIASGPVFVPVRKGDQPQPGRRLSTNAVEEILAQYPVLVDARPTAVSPHVLRRTYAWRLYSSGLLDLVSIQQNLGHASVKTTEIYVGALPGAIRALPADPASDEWLRPLWQALERRQRQGNG